MSASQKTTTTNQPARGAAQQPQAAPRRRRRGRIPPRRYRVGELVEFAGVSRQTIHNYTTMGLLPEAHWTPGGHRLYDASAFERLERIAELKASEMTMAQIREHFARMDAGET
ncbi:MAG: MerR family transcriptional regulator [Planctomycetota bacterium]